MERTITIPGSIADAIDDLALRYAATTGDESDAAKRLVEVSVLTRGVMALKREFDSLAPAVPPAGERVA